jgi:hypothetical protein
MTDCEDTLAIAVESVDKPILVVEKSLIVVEFRLDNAG